MHHQSHVAGSQSMAKSHNEIQQPLTKNSGMLANFLLTYEHALI